jgi:hypothetical protein
MSINNITQALQQAFAKIDQTLFIRGDTEFGKTLNMGQILKGKVLRHYEGSRYLVSFNGQEKVVDSAVPLKTGELLYGRVIGLGDQVKLQRLALEGSGKDSATPQTQSKGPGSFSTLSANERLLYELFAKYQAALPEGDRATIVSQMNKSSNGNLMALSSLILSKLGLMQAPEFLKGVFRNLQGEHRVDAQNVKLVPKMVKSADSSPGSGNVIQQLSEILFTNFHSGFPVEGIGRPDASADPEPDGDTPMHLRDDAAFGEGANDRGQRDNSDAHREWLLGRWILNLQNEGSVAHRLSTFPVWFGGNLVEVSVAIFGQHKNPAQAQLHHKKLVFSLTTEYLGRVELTVAAANRHLNVDVVADNEHTAVYMAGYIAELKQTLKDAGWQVDAINYGATGFGNDDGVVNAVVEHHVTQNSLNQLI